MGPPNIVCVIESIRLRWVGHVDKVHEDSVFKSLRSKPTGKRPSGRRRRRREDNIGIYLK